MTTLLRNNNSSLSLPLSVSPLFDGYKPSLLPRYIGHFRSYPYDTYSDMLLLPPYIISVSLTAAAVAAAWYPWRWMIDQE